MKIQTKAVHAGDRKRGGGSTPVTTPIYTASSYIYDNIEDLDKVFAHEMEGPSYARYNTPTNQALEELVTALEGGAGSLACSSGMMSLYLALLTGLNDRRRCIVAAKAMYGATIAMLTSVIEPSGVEIHWVDFCDLDELERVTTEAKPGCLLVETISNPLLRVAQIDRVAAMAQSVGAVLIVDSTFATPLVLRPLEWGAHIVVHSLTKYLSGHGDVLGGIVVSDAANLETLRSIARTLGPALGPFESYLVMRGIKTFALRVERQNQNACRVASWLATNSNVERVFYLSDPKHPEAAVIERMFEPGLYGAVVSFELKDAGRERVFRFMNSLKMIVPATSVGDVHSMMLYPVMSSHRDLSPKHRARMGIKENLVRLSVGIEAVEDIIEDLDQAFQGALG